MGERTGRCRHGVKSDDEFNDFRATGKAGAGINRRASGERRVDRLSYQEVASLIRMHRLRSERIRVEALELLGEELLQRDVPCLEVPMQFFDDINILRQIFQHLRAITFLERIVAEEERTDKQDVAVGNFSRVAVSSSR